MIEAVSTFIFPMLKECDVYLIFDQYYAFNVKSDIRKERQEAFFKDHKFTEVTPLPTKEAALGSNKNKAQLIELVSRVS